jgi:hypothetical protein
VNPLQRIREAIHYYFYAVAIEESQTAEGYLVVLPHLVTHRPDAEYPDTLDRDYQHREVASDVEAIIRRSQLPGATYTIRPNGHTEGENRHWYQFHVVITIPGR